MTFVPNLKFFCFPQNFFVGHKFESADCINDNNFFKFHSKNTQIKHFALNIKDFYFFTKLCIDKFESPNFK